ncbi:MAG: hypothetical protein COA50_16405 [Flavobacteriaceae bacterium]|nr:MAG: hypothetical protein COA50_16405 [Flavobacteriaceae bacterium]
MALQFIDKKYIAAILIDVWQNYLNTEKDPTSGKYYTSGPNNSGGLYGGLTDTLADKLAYDPGKYFFSPHQKTQMNATYDNRDGKMGNPMEKDVDVTFTWEDSTTTEHSKTTGITTGVTEEIALSTSFAVVEASFTTTISFEATHSWTDTETKTKSASKSINLPLPLVVPEGKAYQVVLTYNEDALTVDYLAKVFLSGTSWAYFDSPVNGKKIHSLDAGTLCKLINKYGSAKNPESSYGQNSKDLKQGFIAYKGKINATQNHNFVVRVFDVTANYDPSTSKSIPKNAKVVNQQKVPISN